MKVKVNPDTEVSGFGYAEAGRYKLRVVGCRSDQGPKAPYLNWEFEFADPNVKPTTGKGKVGHVFEITTLKEDAQFALRGLVEAIGATWGDFDTEELIGREFDAQVDVDQYQGVFKNVVKRYVPAGK